MSDLRLVSVLLFECRSIGGLVALKIKFSLDFITNHVGEMWERLDCGKIALVFSLGQ